MAVPFAPASVLMSALKCPMMKTAKVSRAERAGDENEEKSSATATMIVSSKKTSAMAGKMCATSGS